MRICSLLPSATEIVCALGLRDQLVAVSHECDFPPEVRGLPVITSSRVETANRTSAEINAFVAERLHDHSGIYALDEKLLARLDPDLILTQELCDVCAVSYEQVQEAVRALHAERTLLSLEPETIAGVMATIRAVADAAGCPDRAEALVSRLEREIEAVAGRRASRSTRPRVACLEWLDPPFAGGHWVPEMVDLAGGADVLSAAGTRSRRVQWSDVLDARAEVYVLMPCGFDVERTISEYARTAFPDDWQRQAAVRSGNVFAVDASAYFSRPGPRLVRGIEILAEILESPATGASSGEGWSRLDSLPELP